MKKVFCVVVAIFFVINFCMLSASELSNVTIIEARVQLGDFSTVPSNITENPWTSWNLLGIECPKGTGQTIPVVEVTAHYLSSHPKKGYKSWMSSGLELIDDVDTRFPTRYSFPKYAPLSLFFVDGYLKKEPIILRFKAGKKNFQANLTVTNRGKFKQAFLLSHNKNNIYKGVVVLVVAFCMYWFYLKFY